MFYDVTRTICLAYLVLIGIVGIYTPEFNFKKGIDNVNAAIQRYGIKYPVIQDNDYKNWNSYGNNYWPRMYIVDDQGFIRYSKIGEGGYNQTGNVNQSLLSEKNSNKGIKNPNFNKNSIIP